MGLVASARCSGFPPDLIAVRDVPPPSRSPTALSSRQDLTVIALFRFKEYRRIRRQQGGVGRPAGLAGSRTERGEETKRRSLAGPSSWERCSSSKSCRPRALRARPSSRIACRAIELRTIPSCTRSNPEPRICTTSSATPRRTRSPRTPGCSRRHELSGAGRYGSVLGAGAAAQAWKSDPASHPERLSSPRRGRPMNQVVRSD